MIFHFIQIWKLIAFLQQLQQQQPQSLQLQQQLQPQPLQLPQQVINYEITYDQYKYCYKYVDYSHLSNKRDATLTDFGKFHPAQNKNPPCTFIDFITDLSIFLQNFQYSYRT